jgi:heme exporter protein B
MIHKDLVSEWRARHAWPAMFVLGAVVALLLSLQTDLPPREKSRMVAMLLWLAVYFAGMIAIDRSFAVEREDNCWEILRLYPVRASVVFLAKLVVNILALTAVEIVLVPLFIVLCDTPQLASPAALLPLILLANIGLAAVGTLLSAVTARIGRDNLLAILVLPLVTPVLVAAAEASRLVMDGDFGPLWSAWMRLLVSFGVIFVTAGAVLFEFVLED